MSKSRAKRRSKVAAHQQPKPPNRRDVLKLARNGALGLAAAGGAGYWATGSFRAHAAEHDLTRLGQGSPAIVQVHDPSCPMCTALQKQTRAALKSLDECGLIYLVADINTPQGAALAARHGVPHVTLLFFDRTGRLLNSLNGVHTKAQLTPLFEEHKSLTRA